MLNAGRKNVPLFLGRLYASIRITHFSQLQQNSPASSETNPVTVSQPGLPLLQKEEGEDMVLSFSHEISLKCRYWGEMNSHLAVRHGSHNNEAEKKIINVQY